MRFDVYRKRGKGWELIYLNLEAKDSLQAAYQASYTRNLKVIGVRPSDAPVNLFVHRLKHVASLSYA